MDFHFVQIQILYHLDEKQPNLWNIWIFNKINKYVKWSKISNPTLINFFLHFLFFLFLKGYMVVAIFGLKKSPTKNELCMKL